MTTEWTPLCSAARPPSTHTPQRRGARPSPGTHFSARAGFVHCGAGRRGRTRRLLANDSGSRDARRRAAAVPRRAALQPGNRRLPAQGRTPYRIPAIEDHSARIWPRRSRAAISGERDRERRRGLARFVAGPNPFGDPCRGRARNRLAAKGRAHRRMARFARHAGRRDGFRPARRRLHGFFDRRRWISAVC